VDGCGRLWTVVILLLNRCPRCRIEPLKIKGAHRDGTAPPESDGDRRVRAAPSPELVNGSEALAELTSVMTRQRMRDDLQNPPIVGRVSAAFPDAAAPVPGVIEAVIRTVKKPSPRPESHRGGTGPQTGPLQLRQHNLAVRGQTRDL
jgi:hypothetical protein